MRPNHKGRTKGYTTLGVILRATLFSFERKEDLHGTDQRQRHRSGRHLLAYLTDQEYRTDRIAIELNGDIVSRKDYDKVTLKDGDSMEIVHFVGGG